MNLERYTRQILVRVIGRKAQETLATKHAVVIGGGGLGSTSSAFLVRMGIGQVDIIDKDLVTLSNLHRTSVFTEEDVGKPKSKILAQRLRKVNSDVVVDGKRICVTQDTIEDIVDQADIIVDGTDNLETRFLLNEASVKLGIPWVYAGVNETVGMVMGILPEKTPCFSCLTQAVSYKSAKELPMLGNLPVVTASIQCSEIIKLLLEQQPSGLLIYDIWKQLFDKVTMNINRNCMCCQKHQFKFLK
jgi:adenylyltransferase/sulfurtransferase